MKTYSLYDNAVTTCMGNDYGYEYIFRSPWSFCLERGICLLQSADRGLYYGTGWRGNIEIEE